MTFKALTLEEPQYLGRRLLFGNDNFSQRSVPALYFVPYTEIAMKYNISILKWKSTAINNSPTVCLGIEGSSYIRLLQALDVLGQWVVMSAAQQYRKQRVETDIALHNGKHNNNTHRLLGYKYQYR